MPNEEDLQRYYRELEQSPEYQAAKKELLSQLVEVNPNLMKEKQKDKPILCLDFDGVIHSYTSGWQGVDVISDPPVKGAISFLYDAICYFDVCIYSTRNESDAGINAMREWLAKWEQIDRNEREKWGMMVERTGLLLNIRFPKTKPSAFVGIDDRVLTFTGEFPNMETLKNFKPWNK